MLNLFLTSKVRLHCDRVRPEVLSCATQPFPDLKGQAPLRPVAAVAADQETVGTLFLTSKVRLHCDDLTFSAPKSLSVAFS